MGAGLRGRDPRVFNTFDNQLTKDPRRGCFAALAQASLRIESQVGDDRLARQGRGAEMLPRTKTTTAAWRVKPVWYQVSTEDRTINPELERFLAKRMKATTIELDSSHVPMVSHPKEIAALILRAAGSMQPNADQSP
jgi:pimeloyl-ACP methyl ester carboxylesterase